VTYAADTKVPVDRSRAEIERTLVRYGADAFSYGYDEHRAVIQFRAHGRMVRLDVPVPTLEDVAFTPSGERRSAAAAGAAREKLTRARWRALALVVKAKLEAVESGIVGFEEEFLAHIMLPDASTVGDWMAEQLDAVYTTGSMPEVLPPARSALRAGSSRED